MNATGSLPFSLKLYRAVSGWARPLFDFILNERQRRGKEVAGRLDERKGVSKIPRPEGRLIWLHGASVGESLVGLTVAEKLRRECPDAHILLTSGTVTSADLLARRIGDGMLHQFVPVDHPGYVERFLDHWRPDLAFWIESEIWPNLIMATAARQIPMALLNARMSDKSFQRWVKRPRAARALFQPFWIALAADKATAEKLQHLGVRSVDVTGNLKLSAAPLPFDRTALSGLKQLLSPRPIWLAASTHDDEELQCAEAQCRLRENYGNALLVIVPRHPERGPSIAASLKAGGHKVAMRSRNEMIERDTEIYVADTLGELGLFYRLAEIVFVGGSLIGHGGQNPLESARLQSAILHGPNIQNFKEIYDELDRRGAALSINNAHELADKVASLLKDKDRCANLGDAAQHYVTEADAVIDRTIDALKPLLAFRKDS